MCFSAVASFTSSVILVTAGIVCLSKTLSKNKSHWVFSLFPLAFGIQQAFEGGVWLTSGGGDNEWLRMFALGFLFFSHFFWPLWVPYSCYLAESAQRTKRLFKSLTVLGAGFGLTLYLPFIFNPSWLSVSIVNHSVIYDTTLVSDAYLPREIVTSAYVLLVIAPLLLSVDRYYRILGVFVLLSMVFTLIFFNLAFISVWCYFAAIISMYVYYIAVFRVVEVRRAGDVVVQS